MSLEKNMRCNTWVYHLAASKLEYQWIGRDFLRQRQQFLHFQQLSASALLALKAPESEADPPLGAANCAANTCLPKKKKTGTARWKKTNCAKKKTCLSCPLSNGKIGCILPSSCHSAWRSVEQHVYVCADMFLPWRPSRHPPTPPPPESGDQLSHGQYSLNNGDYKSLWTIGWLAPTNGY